MAQDRISDEIPNGAGGAAVLAAGVGAFVLAVLAIAADHIAPFKHSMIFYRPTGPLSGVTSSAILIWLAIWLALHLRWHNRTVASGTIGTIAVILLCLAVALTFPPLADLF